MFDCQVRYFKCVNKERWTNWRQSTLSIELNAGGTRTNSPVMETWTLRLI